MLAKRIIPCLDLKEGKVVKGINFLNLIDAGDPVETAKRYNEMGADEIVFLDITASSDARNIMLDVISKAAEEVYIPPNATSAIYLLKHWGKLRGYTNDPLSLELKKEELELKKEIAEKEHW